MGVQSMRGPPAAAGSRIGVSSPFVAFSTSGGWRARSPVLYVQATSSCPTLSGVMCVRGLNFWPPASPP
jgi:hypothetical protein